MNLESKLSRCGAAMGCLEYMVANGLPQLTKNFSKKIDLVSDLLLFRIEIAD